MREKFKFKLLGSGIGRTATVGVEKFVGRGFGAKAQIAHFHHVGIHAGEKDVLGLDVTMYDAMRVHVLDGREHLTEYDPTVGFAYATVVRDLRVELALRCVLHANEQPLLGVYDLVEADYVRMMQLLHARDLAQQQTLGLLV